MPLGTPVAVSEIEFNVVSGPQILVQSFNVYPEHNFTSDVINVFRTTNNVRATVRLGIVLRTNVLRKESGKTKFRTRIV